MTRQEKNESIDQLAAKLDANKNIYLADISGMTVTDSNNLRRLCFNKGVGLEVVKNTLLRKAMEKVDTNYEESYDLLVGNTALMFAEAGNLPAKVIKEFRKKHERPILKGAYVDTSFYEGDEQVKALASLKSKDELIGEIIGLLQSPAKNVISALQSGGNNLSGILKTLGDRPDAPAEATAKAGDAAAAATEAPVKEEATEASAEAPADESTEADAKVEEATEASSDGSTEAKAEEATSTEEVKEESTDAGETTEASEEAAEEAGSEEKSESNDEETKD